MEPQQPTQPQWSPPPGPAAWDQRAGQTGRPPAAPSGGRFADFLMFRWMITPSLIVVIYVIGVIGITLFAVFGLAVATTPGGLAGGLIGAVIFWVIAQVYLRVILEVLIVLFRLYESVRNIDRKTRDQ